MTTQTQPGQPTRYKLGPIGWIGIIIGGLGTGIAYIGIDAHSVALWAAGAVIVLGGIGIGFLGRRER